MAGRGYRPSSAHREPDQRNAPGPVRDGGSDRRPSVHDTDFQPRYLRAQGAGLRLNQGEWVVCS